VTFPDWVHTLNVANANLPDPYVQMKEALRACAKRFTPEGYLEATVAMLNCVENDPCEAWPDGPEKLAAYARICDDNELHRLIRRVEKKRAAWKDSQQPTNDR
jgi:hypothetical protein